MTSKSSSSNKPAVAANRQITIWQLTCKVIKRHIWLPVLAMLGFVLAFPVSTALCINNFMSYNGWNNVEPFCRDLLLLWQGFSVCIIVVGALLSAFVLFRYLHVRKQVDFYHSLPVRREKFFFSNLLAGLLVFLAPYLAAILLNFLVLAVSGWLSYLSVGHYLQYILFNVLVYLLFFGCGSLAMQLSGTMPSAFKVLLLTFGLAPLFACMFELLGACFFDTWVSFFSPVSVVMLKASVIERLGKRYGRFSIQHYLAGLAGRAAAHWRHAGRQLVALSAPPLRGGRQHAGICLAKTLLQVSVGDLRWHNAGCVLLPDW